MLADVPGQAHVHLMHQRRRLQRVRGSLPSQIVRGQLPQLGVHQRHQLLERVTVSGTEIGEQLTDIARKNGHAPGPEWEDVIIPARQLAAQERHPAGPQRRARANPPTTHARTMSVRGQRRGGRHKAERLW
jgi:hypothetical protein